MRGRGDGLDLDKLIRVAEHGHAERVLDSARAVARVATARLACARISPAPTTSPRSSRADAPAVKISEPALDELRNSQSR